MSWPLAARWFFCGRTQRLPIALRGPNEVLPSAAVEVATSSSVMARQAEQAALPEVHRKSLHGWARTTGHASPCTRSRPVHPGQTPGCLVRLLLERPVTRPSQHEKLGDCMPSTHSSCAVRLHLGVLHLAHQRHNQAGAVGRLHVCRGAALTSLNNLPDTAVALL